MCAILGMGFQMGHKIRDDKNIWDALSRLFIECYPRGRTSTGIAITNAKDVVVVKDRMPATEFVETKVYKETLKKYLSLIGREGSEQSRPLSVIGHCRLPTKGSASDNNNNHPITSGKIVGVHNGSIGNDELLWKDFDISNYRRGEVDSEIIFGLIDQHIEKSDGSYAKTREAIMNASTYLRGGYACAMVNARNPYCVWLFRNYNPCNVRHYYKLGLVIWASTDSAIEKAVEDSNFGPYDEIELKQDHGMGIDLHQNKFEIFELNDVYTATRVGGFIA